MTDIDGLIAAAAKKHGINPELFRRMIMKESSGNPNARSPVGAMGLSQLMPGTAREMGVKDINDPEQNLMGGAKYYRSMLDQFGGDERTAAAAYNAGPGNVRKYGGIPPFKETQDYVSKLFPDEQPTPDFGFDSGVDFPVSDNAELWDSPLGRFDSPGPIPHPQPSQPNPQPTEPEDEVIDYIRSNGLLEGLNSPNLYEEATGDPAGRSHGKGTSMFDTARADLDNLRQAIAARPLRENNERGTGGKILDSILAAGTGYLRGPEAGVKFGTDLLDDPYNKAIEQWKGRTTGLEDIADISGKQANWEASSQDRKLRAAALLEAAKQRKDKAGRPIKFTKTEGGVTTEEWVSPEEAVRRGSHTTSTVAERNRQDQAGKIELQAPEVIKAIDSAAGKASESTIGKIAGFFGVNSQVGPVGGRISELEKIAGSESPEVRNLIMAMQSFDALMPILHGYRGGAVTHKIFTDALGTLHTNPDSLKAAVKAALVMAHNIKNGTAETLTPEDQAKEDASALGSTNTGTNRKSRKLRDGTVIYEED